MEGYDREKVELKGTRQARSTHNEKGAAFASRVRLANAAPCSYSTGGDDDWSSFGRRSMRQSTASGTRESGTLRALS